VESLETRKREKEERERERKKLAEEEKMLVDEEKKLAEEEENLVKEEKEVKIRLDSLKKKWKAEDDANNLEDPPFPARMARTPSPSKLPRRCPYCSHFHYTDACAAREDLGAGVGERPVPGTAVPVAMPAEDVQEHPNIDVCAVQSPGSCHLYFIQGERYIVPQTRQYGQHSGGYFVRPHVLRKTHDQDSYRGRRTRLMTVRRHIS
jgi:hypothetical protein